MSTSLIGARNMNIGYLCTGWQCELGHAGRVALRHLSPALSRTDYTFADLDAASNQFAAACTTLLHAAVGDTIVIYLPAATPEMFYGFLGGLKAGLIVSNTFASLGRESVQHRLLDSGARLLLTQRSLLRRLEPILQDLPDLHTIILVDGPQDEPERTPQATVGYQQLVAGTAPTYDAVVADRNLPSVLHYTSGSTGQPKGVLHTHGGIETQLQTMNEVFQVQDDDLFWCTADPGWVTGTTYGITGPWAAGLTQVHFAGRFDPAAWYTILQDQGVTIWYTAPTALRMLMRQAGVAPDSFDLASLKRVYSVGEPLNPEVIHWVLEHFHADTYDTWFQTETGCVMIANRPGVQWKIGAMGLPVTGIEPAIINEQGGFAAHNETGRLMLRAGWASMFRTYLNHHDTYAARFTGDLYDTHDLAYVDADGYYWNVGRNDDVINTAGHLVSPFEVESALIETGDVAEAAVIGAPDPDLYEKVVAFVSLREGVVWSKKLEVKIRVFISNRVSTTAVPSDFIVMDDLPKNQSGKIMRRILRAQYAGETPGDTSTLAQQ